MSLDGGGGLKSGYSTGRFLKLLNQLPRGVVAALPHLLLPISVSVLSVLQSYPVRKNSSGQTLFVAKRVLIKRSIQLNWGSYQTISSIKSGFLPSYYTGDHQKLR